jgi:putative ABC transport system permease protein
MALWPRWRAWLRRFSSAQAEQEDRDLEQEIAFHLATEAERRVGMGQSPDEARASARRDFGNPPLVEEVTRGMSGRAARERLVQDIRFAMRTLSRDVTFTSVALGMLALGIGATVTVFAIINAVLLTPLPFPDPERVVMVWERHKEIPRNMVSPANYVDWRARNRTFESIGLVSWIPMNVTGLGGDAEQVDGLRVTAEFFDALGVPPLLGRTIRSGEDVAGGPMTVVLAYRFWQQRYGGAPDVLGRLLNVNGAAYEIVGVMPPSFTFPGVRTGELYIALQLDLSKVPTGRSTVTVARMRRDVTLQVAQADMERLAAELASERPQFNQGMSATVIPLLEQAVGDTRQILWVVFGAVGCLLLLACANIANLMMMRASTRAPEMAVRLALGAGRWRLVHQLLVESLVLSLGAGALGLLLASFAVPLIPTLFPPSFPLPRANEIGLDASLVMFAVAVSALVGVLFGLFPAWQARQGSLADPLRSSARTIAGTHARVRRALVIVEVAIAIVLAIAAGLMGRSLTALYRVETGFQPDRVLTLRMLIPPTKYGTPNQRIAFLRDVIQGIRTAPGIVSASSIHFLPLSGIGSSSRFYRADRPWPDRGEHVGGDVSLVTDGYFRTMGIPLLQGRDFDERDRLDAPRVVIVNETLVSQWFPNEPAIGQRLRVSWSSPTPFEAEIIGIARDVRTSSLDKGTDPAIYLPQTQETSVLAAIVVRTVGPPASAIADVRSVLRRIDPDQGVAEVQSMDAVIESQTARPKVQVYAMGAFGVLALMVASIGLYGVMSYAVTQRRREMGVRVALGAAPGALLRLVVGEGLALAIAGIVLGVGLALGASSAIAGLLYETQATDPTTFLVISATLLIVAGVASLAPALRATRVDPIVVLRDQ